MKPCNYIMNLVLAGIISMLVGCGETAEKPRFVFDRARLLTERGHFGDALDLLQKLPPDIKSSAECLFEKGKCYEGLEQLTAAEDAYAAVLKVDPKNADATNNLGAVLARLGKYQEAVEKFSILIKRFPDEVLAYRNRGLCYHDLEKYDLAFADYNQGLALKSDQGQGDMMTLFQRGNLYMQMADYQSAIADYSQVIARDDAHAGAWMNRGVARFRVGQKKEGMADLLAAQERNDNIAIPDLDWLGQDTPKAHQTAKPNFEAHNWTAAKLALQDFLSQNGYKNAQIIYENESSFCGLWSAKKDAEPISIVVGRQSQQTTVPRLPRNQPVDLILISMANQEFQFECYSNWKLDGDPEIVLIKVTAP